MGSGKWWVGIDWGTEFHQVCVLDSEGKCLGERKFFHTSASMAEMTTWLISRANASPRLIHVAIERPHGAVVELLLQRDFAVSSINPKQLDRFRDRHTVAGAKDDRRDAFVLADSLRADTWAFSSLQIDDPTIVEIRELIRVDEDLRAEENGLQNRLREQLLRYFPAMLTLIADRADPFLWSLLELATTHDEASRISPDQITSLLKKHRLRRLTLEQVLTAFQSPKLQVSEATVSAATSHIRMLIPRLRLVHQQRDNCGKKHRKTAGPTHAC
jgi:transposase